MKRIVDVLGGALRFVLFGIPAFLVALPLNYALVDVVGWPKPWAYALVLLVQVSMNFVMCRLFVFENNSEEHILSQFLKFMAGILAFRVLDWGLYVFAVNYLGLYYLAVQIANVFIFSVGKFLFARRLFEKGKLVPAENSPS